MVPAGGDARVIALGIALASLVIWLVLLVARDGFWQTAERDSMLLNGAPAQAGAQGFGRRRS